MYSAYACHKSEYTTMAFLPMKMWLQQQAIKRKKLLQPGSNELKLYPFKSIAEIRINKDSKRIPQNKKPSSIATGLILVLIILL